MNVLVLCATLAEFGAYLHLFRDKGEKGFSHLFPTLTYSPREGLSIVVVNMGIGKVRAAAATSYFLSTTKWDLVINAGLCGTLYSLQPGQICLVDSVIQHDFDLTALGEAKYLPLKVEVPVYEGGRIVKLATGDSFIENPSSEFLASTLAEICDMEGYAVVAVHHIFGCEAPLYLFKMVSDGGDSTQYECNLDSLCSELATKIIQFIDASCLR